MIALAAALLALAPEPAPAAQLGVAGPHNADTLGIVWADGRDAWTLLDRKLVNRSLFEQLAAQGYRLAHGRAEIAAAADTALGTEVQTPSNELTRYHGFGVVDLYAAVRLLDAIDVNLTMLAMNASASDGYRASSQVLPDVALHVHHDLGTIGARPLRLDFVAIDLDEVTVGRGLLVEQVPLEGHAGSLRWGELELREIFGGRLFWPDDDLQTVSLRALGGDLELLVALWDMQTRRPIVFGAVDPRTGELAEAPAGGGTKAF